MSLLGKLAVAVVGTVIMAVAAYWIAAWSLADLTDDMDWGAMSGERLSGP